MKRSLSRKPASLARARFRSLLVPIDLTPSSDRILGRLSLLPLADDARLTVLHVIPRSLTPTEQRNARRDVSKALVGEVRHLRRSLPKNVSVDPLVRLGSTAKEIGACATKVRAELIVMGGRSGRAPSASFGRLSSRCWRFDYLHERPTCDLRSRSTSIRPRTR